MMTIMAINENSYLFNLFFIFSQKNFEVTSLHALVPEQVPDRHHAARHQQGLRERQARRLLQHPASQERSKRSLHQPQVHHHQRLYPGLQSLQ